MAAMVMAAVASSTSHARKQVAAAVGNSSVVVKTICIIVFFCYFFSFSDTAIRLLAVTPGLLLPPNFWIWTLFTNSFFEVHIWDVAIDIFVVTLCGKLLEPLWGAFEMLVFFQIVNIGVAVLASLSYLVTYMATFNTDALFEVHIHGLVGYLAGFSVAVKQIMPDNVLINSPLPAKLRNKHVPLLLMTLAVLLWAVGVLRSPYPFMFGYGMIVSWIYLRFYQRHSNGTKGDMADNFSFASFFPDVISPVVAMISNTVFQVMVQLKVCNQPVTRYDVGSPTSITISLPGANQQDAERRRQKALKALDERMSSKRGGDAAMTTKSWLPPQASLPPSITDSEKDATLHSSVSPAPATNSSMGVPPPHHDMSAVVTTEQATQLLDNATDNNSRPSSSSRHSTSRTTSNS